LGGDFFTGAVLASSLTKLVLRFAEKSDDRVASNTLRAEVGVIFLWLNFLTLTIAIFVGHVDHDFRYSCWTIQVRHGPDR